MSKILPATPSVQCYENTTKNARQVISAGTKRSSFSENIKNTTKNARRVISAGTKRSSISENIKETLMELKSKGVAKDENRKCDLLTTLYKYFEDIHKHFMENKSITLKVLEEYLLMFNDLWKPSILETINYKFSESQKLAINCWCVSVNLVGLFYYHYGGQQRLSNFNIQIIIEYLNEFHKYIRSNSVARQLTEVILYCLCNICRSSKLPSDEMFKKLLQICFEQNSSISIKIASGIILSFIVSSKNPLMCNVLLYLESLKLTESKDKTYLGIDKDLITDALKRL